MDWETLVGCSSRTCIWCFGSKRDQWSYVFFSETFRFGFIFLSSFTLDIEVPTEDLCSTQLLKLPNTIHPKGQGRPASHHPHTSKVDAESDVASMRVSVLSRSMRVSDMLFVRPHKSLYQYVCSSARKYSDSYLVPKNLRIYNRVWQVISLPLVTGARSKF